MDMLGVSDYKMKSSKRSSEGKRRSSPSRKNGIKVVYISSPMKVKTSASEFRATVQELTGRDSDVVRLMDTNNSSNETDYQVAPTISQVEDHQSSGTAYYGSTNNFFSEDYNTNNNNNNYYYDRHSFENDSSPAESESVLVERFDDGNLFSMPHMERSFRENDFTFAFQESALLDVLN